MRTHLSDKEFFTISRDLEKYHSVFYKFWELGKLIFTTSVPTAAVVFNKQGGAMHLLFNPDFWDNISQTRRLFILAHECLHVILNHGMRIKNSKYKEACNQTLDIVVNHSLVKDFGFKRKSVDPDNIFCWVDTVFPGKNYPDDKVFEYYFNRLDYEKGEMVCQLVDSHEFLNGEESEEVIGKLNKELDGDAKETLRDLVEKNFQEDEKKKKKDQQRGDSPGTGWVFCDPGEVKKKRKWESIIKHWARKRIKDEFDTFEHWARINRRLLELPEDIILPVEMELQEKEDKSKNLVYFFMDSSGSCSHCVDRFARAAKSLPKDRFDSRYFCFDTIVYRVDEKNFALRGFGGTRFDIMEQQIQDDIKKEKIKRYPHAVFVLTDGYSSPFVVEIPKRWYFFMITNCYTAIPKGAHIFNLSKFE